MLTVLGLVGIVFFGIFALIGFVIGTFKMPDVPTFEFVYKARKRKVILWKIESVTGRTHLTNLPKSYR